MEAKSRHPLLIAFFTIFLDLLGFGILIPIQPFYAEAFGASPTVVTWIGASYSAMQFVFAPFWGRLSDRYGRRPIILISVVFSVVGYILFGLAASLSWLFAARVLSGFGNANLGTAQAIISDCTTEENRAKGMGLIGMAFGLGFLLGPAVGGFLSQWGQQTPIFCAAALSGLNFVVAWVWLPETLRREDQERTRSSKGLFFAGMREAVSRPATRAMLGLTFLVTVGFALMEQVLGLFIEHIWLGAVPADAVAAQAHYRQAAVMTSYVLVVVGIMAILVQGGLIGRLVRRFGELPLMRFGFVLMALAWGSIPWAGAMGSFSFLLVLGAILAVGTGLQNPTRTSLLSRSVFSDESGVVLGLGQSLSALGRVIGPLVAGMLFEQSASLPFYVGSSLLLLCALFSWGFVSAKDYEKTPSRGNLLG